MFCPKCSERTRVYRYDGRRRRRQCIECGFKFSTTEYVIAAMTDGDRGRLAMSAKGEWLPLEPWRHWLQVTVDLYKHKYPERPRAILAARLGVSTRRLWEWIDGKTQRVVNLNVVEDCLWRYSDETSDDTSIDDIWPGGIAAAVPHPGRNQQSNDEPEETK